MQHPRLDEEERESLWNRAQQAGLSRRQFLILIASGGAAAVLAACVPTTSLPPAATPAAGAPAATAPAKATAAPAATGPSGELRFGVANFGGGETFYPPDGNRATNQYMMAPMFEYLVRTDPPADGTTSVGVAEKWELAKDGLSWTFYIRKGIKFSNGDDLTAKDVKFSLDAYCAKDAYYGDLRDMVDHVEIPDDYTVRVFTKGAQPDLPSFLNFFPGQQGMIMPKSYFEKVGKDQFKLKPVGSGPFVLTSFKSGDMIQFEAVQKHYRAVPAFQKVSIIQIPEEATAVNLLKTDGVDIIECGIESTKSLEAAGFKTAPLAGNQISMYFMGTLDPRAKTVPTGDIRVRQALSLAIDRGEIGRTFFAGKMAPANAPYMQLQQAGIDVAYWNAQAAKYYQYDLAKAKQLLAEAGFANGFSVKIYSYVTGGANYMPQFAPIIQGYWAKIGVKAEIVPLDFTGLAPMLPGPDDKVIGQVGLHAASGNPVAERALESFFWTGGRFKLLKGGDLAAEVDKLILGSKSEVDPAKRKDMIASVLQKVMDAHVYETIGTVPQMSALGPHVDFTYPPMSDRITQYADLVKQKISK